MKRFIIVFMFVLLNTTLLFAKKGEGWIGPKGGGNFATAMTNYTNVNPKSLIGYNAGFVLGGLMGKSNVLFEMSFLYSTKGYNDETIENGIPVSLKTQLNYIEWPVNFGYRIKIVDNLYLSPVVGFYSAYALSGKETGEANSNGIKVNVSDDIKFGTKVGEYFGWDFGLNCGLNIDYKGLQVSARYIPGIGPIGPGQNIGTVSNVYEWGEIYNRVFSVSVAYLFRFNKK
jgi:hypothetical protein